MAQMLQKKDYTGEDGLRYCGLCHEAKEAFFSKPLFSGLDKHPRQCACQRKIFQEQEAHFQAVQHEMQVERLRRDCFSDPTMADWTFEHSATDSEAQTICRTYVEHWTEAKAENHGLLLWGDVGTGKSYQAGCIANALLEREIAVCMTNLAAVMNVGFQERSGLLSKLGACELLILDDFGMERDSSYGLETVFQVVDRRVSAGKPLIVTTNLSLDKLKHPADLEHKRIYDRVLAVTVPVRFTGTSLRKEQRQEGFRWMKGRRFFILQNKGR